MSPEARYRKEFPEWPAEFELDAPGPADEADPEALGPPEARDVVIPRHDTIRRLRGALLGLLVAVFAAGLVVLAGAALMLAGTPTALLAFPWLADAAFGASGWAPATGALAGLGVLLLAASVLVGAIRGRDAATWGMVVLVASLAILGITGRTLAAVALMAAGLLALAAVGPVARRETSLEILAELEESADQVPAAEFPLEEPSTAPSQGPLPRG